LRLGRPYCFADLTLIQFLRLEAQVKQVRVPGFEFLNIEHVRHDEAITKTEHWGDQSANLDVDQDVGVTDEQQH
jgi:hypothetical protein